MASARPPDDAAPARHDGALLEQTKHYERVGRTGLIQFRTIDWVVDGRRERVKMAHQEEQVQRLAEQVHEQGSLAWHGLDERVARMPLGSYVRTAMQHIGAWTSPLVWKLQAVLLSTAENAVVVLVGASLH